MPRNFSALFSALVLIIALGGCGQKGDLYLPSDTAQPSLTLEQDTSRPS